MSDRLAELVRQRALVQEHLAWLNREIATAAEAAKSATAAGHAPAALTTTTGSPASLATSAALSTYPATVLPAVDAEEIIARYQPTPAHLQQDLRKGCLLYFAGAMVLLGIVVLLLYFMLSHRH